MTTEDISSILSQCKHHMYILCWLSGGPQCATLAQHYANIGSILCVGLMVVLYLRR